MHRARVEAVIPETLVNSAEARRRAIGRADAPMGQCDFGLGGLLVAMGMNGADSLAHAIANAVLLSAADSVRRIPASTLATWLKVLALRRALCRDATRAKRPVFGA